MNTPRANFAQRQQIDQFDDHNDSLLDESNSFDLKNQVYQLNSKYNNLEYEKNKLVISYENALKEMKQKYAILERLFNEKQDKEERSAFGVNELRAKCQYLAEENEALKKELHSIFEKNRVTPDFNNVEFAQEVDVLNELLRKEERIQKLDRELQQAKEGEYSELRERIQALERENKKLKEENALLEAERKESSNYKDAVIQQLKEEQENLKTQLEASRKSILQLNSKSQAKAEDHSQLKRKEEKINELEEKISSMESQRQRILLEKSELAEQSRRSETQRRQIQKIRKSYQEEIQLLTNELSEVRAASFNDKIESKKHLNAVKAQAEQEKNKLRSAIEEKIAEKKKLREAVLSLNDENQELKDAHKHQGKQLEKALEELRLSSQQNEKYLRETSKWEVFADQSKKLQRNHEQERIGELQQKLSHLSGQLREKSHKLKQVTSELQRCKQELSDRENLVEIMKIQKSQRDEKTREEAKKLKEMTQLKNQKEKVIQQLQTEIRTLKDDNKQLELANQLANEKLLTLKAINSDIQNIKNQLQLEKQYYQQMRREEQDLRKKHNKSQEFKIHRQEKEVRSKQTHQEAHKSQQSIARQAELSRQMDILRIQNYQLQIKLNQAQNQIDKKGIDLNMKDEQNKKLKEVLNNPRELIFQPLIETNKKTQFNAIFLQNRILQLQKEIKGIKTIKEKEYQDYKKMYRSKVEQKYLGQMKKSSNYINQLQKNCNLLNEKLQHEKEAIKQLSTKIEQLTRQNYQAKYEYSETLEELNSILGKYKAVERQCKEMEAERAQTKKLLEENAAIKSYLEKIGKQSEEKASRLGSANDQIQRLNETLMRKELQLRKLRGKSPNSSYIQNHKSLLNARESEHQASSDSESIRSWVRKGPNYSRI